MFNKKIRRELELFKQELRSKFFETVNCHRCGCMVSKELAIEGEKKIEQRDMFIPLHFFTYLTEKRVVKDVIVTHYYCKRCAPKEKT